MIPILILAAGASRRMRGRDKLLEPVDGVPLLRHVVDTALASGVGPVHIALPPIPHARYALLKDLDITAVPVPDAAEGIGASLRTLFRGLPAKASHALILLADLPEIESGALQSVAQAAAGSAALIHRATTADGAPGHPILISAPLFPAFRSLAGDNGGREIMQDAKSQTIFIALKKDRARVDIDTPEAWQAWRERTGR